MGSTGHPQGRHTSSGERDRILVVNPKIMAKGVEIGNVDLTENMQVEEELFLD